jgi:hypothetical protein
MQNKFGPVANSIGIIDLFRFKANIYKRFKVN